MIDPLLELKSLSVRYAVDKTVSRAVNNINLTVGKGEVLGLVGETGAGKTTTALSILGLLPKYISEVEGEILFHKKNLNGAGRKKLREIRGKHISMIFQDPMTSLNPVFKVGEQIGDVIKFHDKTASVREISEKVDGLLNLVGIPPSRKAEYPNQFSGGMKQRVMIAIAIACNPELLIADEPTTALDVTIQAQVIRMMRGLQIELGSSVILITHDLGIVANFCDKVAIMYAGEIIESGILEDIFDKNLEHHPYTVGLFGSLPNITSRTSRLIPISGLAPHPSELPAGCKFHPRCPQCKEICKYGNNPPKYVNNTHIIRCHLFAERGHNNEQ
jgi:peptide/nickel transport system ATP-binding protein